MALVHEDRRQRVVERRAHGANQLGFRHGQVSVVPGRRTDRAQQGFLALAVEAQQDVEAVVEDGDGELELRESDRKLNPVRPVYWKLKEW